MRTIKQPKRMGRPPLPNGPVSNKDRQQRWRDKVKAAALSLLKAVNESND